ncbi:peptidase M56 family protein [Oscillibacter valericigenes Sjm18-20]|nr:peptidase M56 family protein [Oscillibacter valericigenes Sjm18-20]
MGLKELFVDLLNMSITASYVVIAVIIMRLLLKKAPRGISCALWAMVGLRLILPVSFESVMSLIPSSATVTPDVLYSAEPAISSGVPALNNVMNPVIAKSLSPAVTGSANPMQTAISIAAIVWLTGMLGMVLYSAITYVRVRRKVDFAVLVRDNIYESDAISSPFVLGIVKPRIYLPFAVGEEDRDYVVAHEQAHIRRKDHWIKPLGFLLLTIYWFNPLLWAAYVLLCRDIEVACDEAVIRDIGGNEKKDYSLALLNCAVKHRNIAMCPLAFGEVGIRERVKNVLNYKKPAFRMIIAAVIVCIVAAICLLSNPKEKTDTLYEHPYAEQLFEYRTAYVGDDSSVGNIVGLLEFPSDVSYDHIELQTSAEPYGVEVYFSVTSEVKAAYTTSESDSMDVLRENACIMFSLIGNADEITFRLDDGTENPVDLQFTREWAESVVGAVLWDESGSVPKLDNLITQIHSHVESAYSVADEGAPTGTFKPAEVVYLCPSFSVTADGFLKSNADRTFEIKSDSFGDGANKYSVQYASLDVEDSISTFDSSDLASGAFDVSGYSDKAGWRVLDADERDTGYRIFRMDGEIWIGHWDLSDHDAGVCEYIFRLEAERSNWDEAAGNNAADGAGPFVGYVKDAAADTFDVYTEENGTYIMSLPMSLFDDFPANDFDPGWMEDIDFYCGSIDDFTWAVVCTGPSGGTGNENVCTSSDRGRSWWVGDRYAMYSGTGTGAGFSSSKVGFMSYRYFADQGPEISRTLDGGKTWNRMKVDIPTYLTRYKMTPLIPTFTGDSGLYPIRLYDNAGNTSMAYLVTEDGGMTWRWKDSALDEAVRLAFLKDNQTRYLSGECAGEGHILLGQEEKSGVMTVYALTMYGEYGFEDGNFVKVSGSGIIPAVFTFADSDGGLVCTKIEYPDDGSEYGKSIGRMFPSEYQDRAQNPTDGDGQELESQERSYAESYLKKIGRDAVIGDYGDFEHTLLTDVGVSAEVSNSIDDKRFADYPMWLGSREALENGVRYVYETSYNEKTHEIDFTKYEYNTNTVVELTRLDSVTGKIIGTANPDKQG